MSTPTKRGALLHFYPISGGLAPSLQLAEYLKLCRRLWTGPIIAAIAIDYNCHDQDPHFQQLIKMLDELGASMLFVRNSHTLGERLTFPMLLQLALSEDNPYETLWFYSHSKGAMHEVLKTDAAEAVRIWRTKAWQALLAEYDQRVRPLLESPRPYMFVGTTRCDYSHRPADFSPFPDGLVVPHRWHFSGTMFWFHGAVLRSHEIFSIPLSRWGVEAWPGLLCSKAQSATVYQPCQEEDAFTAFYNAEVHQHNGTAPHQPPSLSASQ